MNTNADIQKKIDEALESIDNLRLAEPNPFFFTRVMARLRREEKNVWEVLSGVISRPAVAFTSVLLVVLLNIFVLVSKSAETPAFSEMAMVDEYQNTLVVYDIDNIQP